MTDHMFSRISLGLLPLILLYSLLPTALLPVWSLAQDSTAGKPEQAAESAGTEAGTGSSTIESLRSIARAIERSRTAIKEKQRTLNRSEEPGREKELRSEIEELSQDIDRLEQNFRQIAAGVDLTPLTATTETEEFNLGSELTALLKPLINELQQLTSAPREIDGLRSSIEELRFLRILADRALAQSKTLLEQVETKGTTKSLLEAAVEHWDNRVEELSTRLEIQTQKLQQRLDSRIPISESFGNVFEIFFKKRGRNLLLAIFLSVTFYLLIGKIYETLQHVPSIQKSSNSNLSRLLTLGYIVATALGTALVFILTLYFSGDWLLLTLAVLLLISLIWGSREALPKYWTQLALLVNVGPVREGERVVVNGIPWLVDRIHLYSRLKNPLLSGGVLRLPIADLSELRSREPAEEEAYFPTHEGDWVLLEDERLARVVLQTPELVQLVELGGAKHSIPTASFIELSPRRLSGGFRVLVVFGVDYAHQEHSTEEIPQTMERFVRDKLEADFKELKYHNLSVEFQAAGASSLDLAIILDVEGSGAAQYTRLRRRLQRYAVEACNSQGWVIPFTQVNLHLAETPLRIANE